MVNISDIVDMLDHSGALALGESPWGTYNEEEQVRRIDWDRLVGRGRTDRNVDVKKEGRASDLDREIEEGLGRRFNDREKSKDDGSTEWDICAWYQPIHFFGYDWGIFIREKCLVTMASRIASFADPAAIKNDLNQSELSETFLRAAFLALYAHEHYHHRIECLGLRLHVMAQPAKQYTQVQMGSEQNVAPYRNYYENVYKSTFKTDKCLEEALANANSYRYVIKPAEPARRALPVSVRDALRQFLVTEFPSSPEGYRKAVDYLGRRAFRTGKNRLQGQVKESILKPSQPDWYWNAAPLLTKGFFDIHSNIWTVVPAGTQPRLPTTVFPYSCSTQDMVSIYQRAGYTVVPQGKGSHIMLKKPGCKPMTLPGNRKDLSPGVLHEALKNINYLPDDLPQLRSSKGPLL